MEFLIKILVELLILLIVGGCGRCTARNCNKSDKFA